MARTRWVSVPKNQRAQGAPLGNYTTAKSVINGQAQAMLAPDFFYAGKQLRLLVAGAISNIVTTPGTLQFLLKLGTIAAPITVWDSGAIQLNASAHTLLPFWMELLLRCDSDGNNTNAKLMGLAFLKGPMFTKTAGQTDSLQGDQGILVPQVPPVVGGGFDATIVNTMDLWAGFSTAAAGNLIRIDHFLPVEYDA